MFNRLAEVPGVSYAGSSMVDRRALAGVMAKEHGPNCSMEPSELLRRLEEALELPGEPVDYHFLL